MSVQLEDLELVGNLCFNVKKSNEKFGYACKIELNNTTDLHRNSESNKLQSKVKRRKWNFTP